MRRIHLALLLGGLLVWAGQAAAQTYPVEVQSCTETVRLDGPPQRALVNDINMVQTVLDLGLADRIRAVSGISGREKSLVAPPGTVASLRQFVARYPTLENILGENPDFMFAGWNYGFVASRGVTPAALEPFGIKTYVLRESCIRTGRREPISMETLYADLHALGAIFGIRERAEALVGQLKARVAAVAERLGGGGEKPRMMYCDVCNTAKAPLTSGSEGMPSLLIRLAGGVSLFDEIPNSYVWISWEEIAKRDPQWIVISSSATPIEATIAHLTSDPQLAHVEAIRKRQFIPLTYAEQTPSTRSVDGLEKIVRAVHPDRFPP